MDRFQVPDPKPLINCKPNILILLQRSIMLADLEVSSEGTCFYSTTDPEGGEVIFYSKKTSTTSTTEKKSSSCLGFF